MEALDRERDEGFQHSGSTAVALAFPVAVPSAVEPPVSDPVAPIIHTPAENLCSAWGWLGVCRARWSARGSE